MGRRRGLLINWNARRRQHCSKSAHDCRALDSNPNGAQRLRRISCVELAKPGRVDASAGNHGDPSVGRGLGRICRWCKGGFALSICQRRASRRPLNLLDWGLCCGAGRGGVCLPRFHVSRLVTVFPRSGWMHRADLGSVGNDSYPVRLVGPPYLFAAGLALGYFRWRSNSTWLTVMVHSAMNIFVFLAAAL